MALWSKLRAEGGASTIAFANARFVEDESIDSSGGKQVKLEKGRA